MTGKFSVDSLNAFEDIWDICVNVAIICILLSPNFFQFSCLSLLPTTSKDTLWDKMGSSTNPIIHLCTRWVHKVQRNISSSTQTHAYIVMWWKTHLYIVTVHKVTCELNKHIHNLWRKNKTRNHPSIQTELDEIPVRNYLYWKGRRCRYQWIRPKWKLTVSIVRQFSVELLLAGFRFQWLVFLSCVILSGMQYT